MTHRLAAVLALALLAGCAAPSVSPQPPPSGDPPIGCLTVDLDACRALAGGAIASLPTGGPRPIYAEVTALECQAGDCERRATVVIELAGAPPVAFAVDLVGGRVRNVAAAETFRRAVAPSSIRLSQQVVQFDLGHCGIWSGIDVDGSFWDPIGEVAAGHRDAINAARGTFSLTSPGTATLRTENGLVLQLVRHPGPKYLPGCD
jgi:hypothetical protein